MPSANVSQVQENEMNIDVSLFKLYVLKDSWHSLHLGSDFQEAWTILKAVKLENSLSVIDSNDIEKYDWATQVITLTKESSERLRDELSKAGIAIPLTSEKNGFVVTFNNEMLYGGIFIEYGSAMKISYPVIYPDFSSEQVTFTIRPIHSVISRYETLDTSLKERIEKADLYDFFNKLGKLNN